MQPSIPARLLLCLAFLGSSAACSAADKSGEAKVKLTSCSVPSLDGEARCGTYEVFENRETRQGRKIPLKIVVLPATGTPREPDPLVYFSGGPGEAATDGAAGLAHAFKALRTHRDIVLVDVRGTGGSAALMCDELSARKGGVQAFLDSFMPADAVRRCRERLEKEGRRLDLYTSIEATDDVAEMLLALGYPKANLLGGSYGTRAVQVFLARHPDQVRTIILEGVVPSDERMPLFLAQHTQEALDGLFAECAGDAACHGAFPDLPADLAAIAKRLETAPVTVEIEHPTTGEPEPVRLAYPGFAQTVRYMLYVPATAVAIPAYLHAAAQGDFRPLAETAYFFGSGLTQMSEGFYLSVVCPEDVAFIDRSQVPAAVAGSFMGDFRVRQQLAACAEWPARKLPPSVLEPVRSEVPALLLSGERDPATPAAGAERVASHLPNSLHLVIPDGSHGTDGMAGAECLPEMVTAFIEAGSTRGLDTSCVSRIRRAPFLLEVPKVSAVELSAADLGRFAGTYAQEGGGLSVTVRLEGDKLKAAILGEETFILLPETATHFRAAGAPPGYGMTFEVENGKATALVLVGGESKTRLPRKPG